MGLASGIFNLLFGCRHRELSRAFTADGETYKVCLKCGKHLRYSWQTMTLVPEKAGKRGKESKPSADKASLDRKAG